jgi:acyl carrier protein
MKRAEILAIVEDLAGVEEGSLTGEEALAGLGEWDSLARAEFRVAVAESWGVRLSGVDLEKVSTIPQLMALLGDHLDG